MKTIALYSIKGGVGKTTAAINLSYLAAAAGRRTLLWDLDPQAASTFAFRVRPRVSGFGKKSLEDGRALGAAIKETDYCNLHLIPADFAYRKMDRFFDCLGKPQRLVTSLLDTLGRDFDVVFLDCPAGFSLLTEGLFAAADAILVPTTPTVLSLRTVARLIKRADRSEARSKLAAFFSMVDRRRAVHRRACEWSVAHPELFLPGQVPYASVVEQMAVRRMPLAVFAAKDSATMAFSEMWAELQKRVLQERKESAGARDEWMHMRKAIKSLIAHLESSNGLGPGGPGWPLSIDRQNGAQTLEGAPSKMATAT
jgi:cellulose biosynthesis protein BcsQ